MGYLEGWKSKQQWLNYTFRTTAPSKFKLVIKYLSGGNNTGEAIGLRLVV
jgi:hypothetical protein